MSQSQGSGRQRAGVQPFGQIRAGNLAKNLEGEIEWRFDQMRLGDATAGVAAVGGGP